MSLALENERFPNPKEKWGRWSKKGYQWITHVEAHGDDDVLGAEDGPVVT